MPIVAAVNGSASVHSEYALLADVVIASDTTVFSGFPHAAFGIVPGDGMHMIGPPSMWGRTVRTPAAVRVSEKFSYALN